MWQNTMTSLPRSYTVWFLHCQDVTLYDFVITRMLYRVFSSLPGCYTVWFLHHQDAIPCVFLTTRMLHCMISSSPGCYTVCFPHYQDVTLYDFFITRMLYHIISYLCILPSWNRTHNHQGIHNRMFRVGLCIRHPLCQLSVSFTWHMWASGSKHSSSARESWAVFIYCCPDSPKLSCSFK